MCLYISSLNNDFVTCKNILSNESNVFTASTTDFRHVVLNLSEDRSSTPLL